MAPEIDLSGLRDIHVMQEPPFWPLATGWWVILGIILLLCITLPILRSLWRQRPIVYAIRKVNKIKQIPDDLSYLKHLSQLLKRVAIAVYGRPKVAALSDTKWQDFLLMQSDSFTKQEAHLIAFAPYENNLKSHVDRIQLTDHAHLWIKKVFKNEKSS